MGSKLVEICADDSPANPRDEMDTVGTMWCWHRNYQLGSRKESREKSVDPADYGGWAELQKAVEKKVKPVVILPVYMYEHGGISLNTGGFSCPWDSGQVGFIFATRERALESFGAKRLTRQVRAKIEACLQSEIETYSAYADGDVYGFRVLEGDEETDSCWGFYGMTEIPYMLEAALGAEDAKKAEEIR
jgi:hypothetical protein